ncbi:hypothetical protein GEMRC1_011020 [Eukaryota sp. GEM-RC1]
MILPDTLLRYVFQHIGIIHLPLGCTVSLSKLPDFIEDEFDNFIITHLDYKLASVSNRFHDLYIQTLFTQQWPVSFDALPSSLHSLIPGTKCGLSVSLIKDSSVLDSLTDGLLTSNVTSLTLSDCFLETLVTFPNLQFLQLETEKEVVDLSPLQNLQLSSLSIIFDDDVTDDVSLKFSSECKLKSLTLDGRANLSSIHGLSTVNFVKISSLALNVALLGSLSKYKIEKMEYFYCDLDVVFPTDFENFEKLKNLQFSFCSLNVESGDTVCRVLEQLTDLSINNCDVSNVSWLKNIPNIKILSLAGNCDISDVESIGSLQNLKNLDISECSSISDLSCLNDSLMVQSVEIFHMDGVAPAENLKFPNFSLFTNLQELYLGDLFSNQIDQVVSYIKNLKNLKNTRSIFVSAFNLDEDEYFELEL